MIIDINHPAYQMKYRAMWHGRFNGAYYYSKEIGKFIIPNIKTDRNWVTINIPPFAADHSIVFIHNNRNSGERYEWLSQFKDLILIIGVPETKELVKHLGKVVYLPLPINVNEVLSYKKEHDKDTCYAGRGEKFIGCDVSGDPVCDLPREQMLEKMSHYKNVYAVGRTAIEAKLLGANILQYDPRFLTTDRWTAIDYDGAIKLLQLALDDVEAGADYIDCTKYDFYDELVIDGELR